MDDVYPLSLAPVMKLIVFKRKGSDVNIFLLVELTHGVNVNLPLVF